MTPASAGPLALQPLRTPQREIWFDQMLHEGVPLYNIGGYVDLPGRIDPVLFEEAVNLLVRRHDNLRLRLTAERDEDGLPLQRFAEPWPVRVPVVDVSGQADPVAAAQAFMRQRFEEPFTLEGQPLFRYDLIKLAEDHFYWLMQYHHLIVDGWGIALLNRSLAELYSDLVAGQPPALESPSYSLYLADDRSYVASAKFEQQRLFWRQHHPQPPERLLTPFYRSRQGDDLVGSGCEPMTLSRAFYDRLGNLGQAHGATLFHVLLAALYVYFCRTGQCDELTIGLPVLNRANGTYKQTAGLFANQSPVRFACGRNLTFADLLVRIGATLKAVYGQQRFPASEIRRAAGADAGRARLADVGFCYESQDYQAAFAGIDGRFTALLHSWGQTPLQLFLRDFHTGADVRIDFVYNKAYFTAEDIQALRERFRVVLETAVSDPHGTVATWPILPHAERQLLLRDWNATEAEYPKDQCLHQLVEAQAERTPEAIALVFEEQSLSYAELNDQANRLAHHLMALGIRPDDRVAIGVERSLEMVVGLLAILKAGGAYVPLDPSYPEDRLAFMVEDSAPVALLVHGATRERLAALAGAELPMVDLEADAAAWAELSAANPEPAALGLRPNHLAYVIYTSGSTGKPKGVMVEHRGVVADCMDYLNQYGLTPVDHVLLMAEISVDASVEQLFPVLFAGGSVILTKFDFTPVGFSRQLEIHAVSLIDVPVVYWRTLVQTWFEQPDLMTGSVLRILIVGGDVMPVDVVALWWQLPLCQTVQLFNVYGPTETTVSAAAFAVPAEFAGLRIPIGRPLPNTRIYVLDGESQPVPIGVAGEMHIGGAGVARGYLNRPELTAERFLSDPYAAGPGARMYRTGDLARWLPDGNLEYIGRADFQVKIRGFRIEPGEIEATLRACEAIQDAVVLAREDAPGEKRLVAYVIPVTSDTDTSDRVAGGAARVACTAEVAALPVVLKEHLRNRLPEYMVPAAFVVLEALPLTPNGKVDRKALPAPETEAYATGAYAPPVGAVEEALAEVWSELLGIERVGRHDDFFALGGHSLLAVSLVERMRRLDLKVDVRALFTTPTLAELAAVVGDGEEVAVPPNRIPPDCTRLTPDLLPLINLEQAQIDRIVASVPGGATNVQDIYPLGPLQEGLLFHHLLQREGDAYVLAALFGFETRERLENFLTAFEAVIARHDIFRTSFVWDGLSEPVQVVWRKAPLPIEEFAFGPEVVDVASALQERLDPRRQRLDLSVAPLFHAAIAEDTSQGRWLLLLRQHHLVADHTTLEVLFEEIGAYLNGGFEALPPPLPYRNYIAQVRLGLTKEAHTSFFQELLGDVDEPTAPFGHLEVRGDGSGIEEARLHLEPHLAQRLRQQARRLGVTPASLFHLAFARVLAATSGRSDVVFGTVLFGRLKGGEGADRVPGLFINTLPVRIKAGEEGVEAAVRRTHRTLASLLRHEHASLALAQRCSGVMAPAPLFSALFNYRHSPQQSDDSPAGLGEGIELLQAEERTNYPFGVSVDDLGEGFCLTTQALAEIGAARLGGYLETATEQLVGALESAPSTAVRKLAVLPPAERQLLLQDWNATEAEYPKDQCIYQMVEAQAERTPEATALVFEEQSLSYGELNARANRLAHHLIAGGVSPDDRVAIGVERSLEMVVGLLAILKAGGAYVPLDPAYPEERLAFMVDDCTPVAVLVHGATQERLAALSGAELPMIDLEADGAAWAELSAANPEPAALGLRPNHLAYVIYTSGSTGKPKGVMVEHCGVCNLVTAQINDFAVGSDSRVLQFASVSFDACVSEVFTALCSGATLHLPSPEDKLVGEDLVTTIARHGLSHATLPPSVLATLPDDERFSTLATLITAGERLPEVLARRWSTGRRLINAYGPTEATVCATLHPCMAETSGDPPIGRPLRNSRIYLLDGDGQPVPIGVVGEIHIGGAGVARGYLNRSELTAERFLTDPYAAESDARLYRTGDLARWLPDGNLEYIGRADFQVKIRGFRIEPGEIEAALRGCVGIQNAVVLAREDAPGEKRLVAYVTTDTSERVAGSAPRVSCSAEAAALPVVLKEHLRSRLPEHMVPAAFVVLEALPLTPNGKVDRKALPAPEAEAYATRDYAPPEGAVEEMLAEVWSELLGIERVGRHDDFFALGGHSLLAVSLVERMRRLDLKVDVRALFTSPTLAELAALVGDGEEVAVPPNRIPPDCTYLTPDLLPLIKLVQGQIDRIVATVPGGAANVQDIYPLGPLQEGLLFHHLLQREGDAYVLASLFGFDTRERLENFLTAFEAVIARHDIFRTSFVWEGLSEPVQVVWRQAPLPIEELAFGPEVVDVASALLERLDPRRQRLDLGVAPLFHAAIAEDTSQGRWLLLLRQHHLVADHTTLEVLFEEMGAFQNGGFEALPPPLPYRNYIAQARLGLTKEAHTAFFQELLGDVDEPTAPFGHLEVRGDGSGVEEARRHLEPHLAERLRQQARRLGVTPAGLFHLAFARVLAATSGRSDVVFGTVLFGRLKGGEGADRVPGLFINTLPVRIEAGEEGVEAAVRRTHRTLASLLRHEHASLALAQRCSGVVAPAPLFSALFNYRHSPEGEEGSANGLWEGIELLQAEERTNYPLSVSVDDLGEGFCLTTQALAEIGAARLGGYLETATEQLVGALESAPSTAVRKLAVLPPAERQLLLRDWNATKAEYPKDQCIHQLVEAQAEQTPRATALVFEEQSLSYSELNARANRLAHHLMALGIRPDDRVAIGMERSLEMVVGLLAILKAGGAYVPLDSTYPEERLAFMVKDSAPVALLVHGATLERLVTLAGEVPMINLEADGAAWAELSATNPEPAALGLGPNQLAYVIYTSGSTGKPKGVCMPHQAGLNLLAWQCAETGFDGPARTLQFSPIGFDVSFQEIFSTLGVGGTLILMKDEHRRDGEAVLRILELEKIERIFLPFVALDALAMAAQGRWPSSLRDVVTAGEQLRITTPIGNCFGNGLCRLYNHYGPTETHVATAFRMPDDVCRWNELPPIGSPIANTCIYLLDGDGQLVPIGVAGELHIGGAGVARGYLNRPELTADRFLADPFSSESNARMYRTGDLARWLPDGNLEYLGRADFQVKIRGFRIELGEVEAALRTCDGISSAVVLAREDEPGDKRLVAYLTADAAADNMVDTTMPAVLKEHLRNSLPEYMVPAAFVVLEALPLTPNGKVDRKALPAPEAGAYATRDYAPPEGAVEEALAEVWSELLGIERVGRHDDFFALGGHSLLAVQLISRLRTSLGVEVSLAELFARPVLADFAAGLAGAALAEGGPIPLADRNQPLPLSFAQQRLWFLDQLEGPSATYNIPLALRLSGKLDAAALRAALDRLVVRHEVLRTSFIALDGEPRQRVVPAADVRFAWIEQDLRETADGEAELACWLEQEAAEPFDLQQGPLARGRLLRLGEEEHALLLTFHHAITDGWSLSVLGRELAVLYGAFREGLDDPLPPLPIQYADYAVWERQWVAGARLQRQAAYWKSALAGAPVLLELPTDRSRPPEQAYVGAMVPVVIDADLTGEIKALARRHGTTLFQVLLAGFAVLLSRLSGQGEVVIGSPSAHRSRGELEGLIGFFVNTLALRINTAGASVAELIERAKAQTLAAQAHEDLPFEQVVELLQPPRSLAHAPLFQVMFAWQNTPETSLAMPGLQAVALAPPLDVAKFDLTLALSEAGEGIEGGIEYATALFDRSTVERWVSHWRTLLRELVEASDSSAAGRLPLLREVEKQLLLRDWNATQAHYPQDQCVHELFEAQVARTPDAVALVFEEQSLSYAKLNARANRLAHHLMALGIRPDDRVAIGVERSLEMVVGLLAILKAGGAYVPLDPSYPEERLAFMVEDSAPVALLAHGATRERLAALAGTVPTIDLEADSVVWRGLSPANPEPAVLGLRPNHLAYVIYTSGSTGRPKGVMVEHRGVSNLVAAQIQGFALGTDSRVLQFASVSFDACVSEVFTALCSGAVLHLPSPEGKLVGEVLVTAIARHGLSHATLPPSVLATLPDDERLSPLGTLITAGERLPEALARRWAIGRRLINAYGPTEATVCATLHPCSGETFGAPPIGRPIANTRIYVLDGEGQPVPIGVVGEMHIGGAGVARGYLNRPELTAERFLPDPYSAEPEARMYRTGDLARWLPDGNLEYIGRADFQVKIRGFRIEPGEIEAALRGCEGIQDAVVVAREDAPGEKRLVAYVTTDTSERVAGSAPRVACSAEAAELPLVLKEHLRNRLPEHMVPAAFVVLEALPLTPNGKVDRKALPAPEAEAYATRVYAPPEGAVEEALAVVWSELLGIERVGRHDDFFALGGHSLLAVQLISRLRMSLGVEVSLAELFARPVLAEFAAGLAGAASAEGGQIPLADRNQPLPLSFAQQRLWFLAQLEGPSATYNMPLALRLCGDLDATSLRKALDRLVVRHEALRTTFVALEGEPRQRIVPAADVRFALDARFALMEQDLRETADGQAELARCLEQEAAEPFDLQQGPLARGRLLRLGEKDHALLLTFHHAISDGWSMGVLMQELGALYGAFRQGLDDPLPPLPIQYADYAVWERQWVAGTRLQRQAAYWKSALAGAPVLLELPTDRPRPPVQDYVGAMVPVALDAELTRKLKALAHRHGATLFQVLLAGFALLLSRLSGQPEVVIGSPSAHRSRRELEGLIGFFVNTLALRLDTSHASVAELIERAKAQTLATQAHEDLPFEQVVELLQPPRSLAHAPLFQVMFAWQNTPESSLAMPGLEAVALAPSLDVAKFDLTLALSEAGEGIEGGIEYATALFDRATVERWVGHWRTLLRELVETSEATEVVRLPLLSEMELELLLRDWNATEADYPKDQCVHQLVEAQADRMPEAVALVFEEQSLSYRELNAQANRLAHHLMALGIRPDDRVAIGVERSLEMVVGLLAILKAGGAYVPLDPAYPEERLAFMVEDSSPVALLMHGATRERFAGLAGSVPMIDLETDGAAWSELSAANPEPDALGLEPNHLAYVIYTSGSTGKPKGVMNEHRAIVNRLLWMQAAYGLGGDDAVLQKTPCSFDVSVWEFFWPLLAGARLVMARPEGHKDPVYLVEVISREGITTLHFVPPMLQVFLDQPRSDGFPCLRRVFCSGEALPSELVDRFNAQLPACELHNLYGPTEAAVDVTAWDCRQLVPVSGLIPIGRPIANTRIYVLDGDGQPVPIGTAGEIHLSGVQVARGYLNRPELTAERFLPDPYAAEPGAQMYRTGDLARWLPDGNLEYIGRADFQVKIRGFRIELGEIEAALRACEGIKDAVVLAREDAPGEKRLVAYVTADTSEKVGGRAERVANSAAVAALPVVLKAQLLSSLPEYMLPSAFVVLKAFPLTPNGKVDRKALPAPEADAYATSAYAPPAGALEEALAELWSELLGIDRVGRHDDFFVLGGHSLLVLRLLSELQQTFGVRLPVGAVFLRPTLADLAEAVADSRLAEEAAALVPLQPAGQAPPLFLLPGAIGSVLYLQPLALALGPDRPVLALPSPGLDGRPPLASVPTLAAQHLQAMRRHQPQGPYMLAGHSSGGRVAFELARQLEEEGESVACLVILDTTAPDADQDRSERSGRELLAELAAVFEELAGVALGLSREEILAEAEEAVALARVMGAFQANGVLFSKRAPVAELQALVEVYRASLEAHDGYRIKGPIRAPIHLLKAWERGGADGFEDSRVAWGWQACSDKDVIVAEVPGTHITMMAPPQVSFLAERLGEILAAASSRGQAPT